MLLKALDTPPEILDDAVRYVQAAAGIDGIYLRPDDRPGSDRRRLGLLSRVLFLLAIIIGLSVGATVLAGQAWAPAIRPARASPARPWRWCWRWA